MSETNTPLVEDKERICQRCRHAEKTTPTPPVNPDVNGMYCLREKTAVSVNLDGTCGWWEERDGLE